MKPKLKNVFLAGLAVAIPVGLTIYIPIFLIDLMDGLLRVIPAGLHPDQFLGFRIPGLGVIATLILIFIAGLIATSYAGGKFFRLAESLVDRIPLVRGIYQAIKQIVQTMVSKEGQSFKKVVLVEFPREGLFTVAFVTGTAMASSGTRRAGVASTSSSPPPRPHVGLLPDCPGGKRNRPGDVRRGGLQAHHLGRHDLAAGSRCLINKCYRRGSAGR